MIFVIRDDAYPLDHPLRTFFSKNFSNRQLFQHKLKPFSYDDTLVLTNALAAESPEVLAKTLYNLSNGNPLFITTILHTFFEDGYLYETNNGEWNWTEKPISNLSGNSLHSLIEARLKNIQLDERHVLDLIAVSGGEIDYDVLSSTLNMNDFALLAIVDKLIQRNLLIEPRSFNAAELMLPHNLYTNVIYTTMPRTRRRIQHQRLAESMSKLGRDQLENAAALAKHAQEGGNIRLAIQAYINAAWYSLSAYVPTQGNTYFEQAKALAEKHPQITNSETLSEILFGIAECQRLLGNYKEAVAFYTQSIQGLTPLLKTAAVHRILQTNMLLGKDTENYIKIQ